MSAQDVTDLFEVFTDELGMEVSYSVPVLYVKKINKQIREFTHFTQFEQYLRKDEVLRSSAPLIEMVKKSLGAGAEDYNYIKDRIFIMLVDDEMSHKTHMGSCISMIPVTNEDIDAWVELHMQVLWN